MEVSAVLLFEAGVGQIERQWHADTIFNPSQVNTFSQAISLCDKEGRAGIQVRMCRWAEIIQYSQSSLAGFGSINRIQIRRQ